MIHMSRQRSALLGVASVAMLASPVSGIAGATGADVPQIADQLLAPTEISVPLVTSQVEVTVPIAVPVAPPAVPAVDMVDAAVAPAVEHDRKLCNKDR